MPRSSKEIITIVNEANPIFEQIKEILNYEAQSIEKAKAFLRNFTDLRGLSNDELWDSFIAIPTTENKKRTCYLTLGLSDVLVSELKGAKKLSPLYSRGTDFKLELINFYDQEKKLNSMEGYNTIVNFLFSFEKITIEQADTLLQIISHHRFQNKGNLRDVIFQKGKRVSSSNMTESNERISPQDQLVGDDILAGGVMNNITASVLPESMKNTNDSDNLTLPIEQQELNVPLSFGTPPKLVETRKNPTTPAQDKTPSSRKRRALQEIGGEVELSEKLITLILLIAAQALMAGIAYSGFMAISYAISVAPAVAANLGIAAWQLPAASAIGSAIISVVKNKDGLFGGNEKAQYKSLRQTLIDMVLIDAGITTIGSLAAVLPASGFDALRAAYQVSSDLPIAEQWGLIVKGLKESASNLLIYVGGAAALALLIKTIYQRRFKSGSSE